MLSFSKLDEDNVTFWITYFPLSVHLYLYINISDICIYILVYVFGRHLFHLHFMCITVLIPYTLKAWQRIKTCFYFCFSLYSFLKILTGCRLDDTITICSMTISVLLAVFAAVAVLFSFLFLEILLISINIQQTVTIGSWIIIMMAEWYR